MCYRDTECVTLSPEPCKAVAQMLLSLGVLRIQGKEGGWVGKDITAQGPYSLWVALTHATISPPCHSPDAQVGPELLGSSNSPVSASQIAGSRGICYHSQLPLLTQSN